MNDRYKDPKAAPPDSGRGIQRISPEYAPDSRFRGTPAQYAPGPIEVLRQLGRNKPFGLSQNFNGYRISCAMRFNDVEFRKYNEAGMMAIPSAREIEIFKSNVKAAAKSNPEIAEFLRQNPNF